jgi:hypothetical protein
MWALLAHSVWSINKQLNKSKGLCWRAKVLQEAHSYAVSLEKGNPSGGPLPQSVANHLCSSWDNSGTWTDPDPSGGGPHQDVHDWKQGCVDAIVAGATVYISG